jgi:hypothetical protein
MASATRRGFVPWHSFGSWLEMNSAAAAPPCVYCDIAMRAVLKDCLEASEIRIHLRCDGCGWEVVMPLPQEAPPLSEASRSGKIPV